MKKSRIIFLVLFLLATTGIFFVWQKKKVEAPIQIKNQNVLENLPIRGSTSLDQSDLKRSNLEQVVIEKREVPVETKLPSKILINVPFTSQAPFGKWDEYHEEACEEASILMVDYFLQKKQLTKEIAESEIQKMIAYQIKNYGDYQDSTAEQMTKLAADFYGPPSGGKNLEVIYDFSKEDLKKELAKGNPIIIPAAGRLLGNPNFTPPGPLYHALVLTGYDENTIITNDPGTRKGEGYQYNINVLYSAIHDFPGDKNKIEAGRKAMIVVNNEK